MLAEKGSLFLIQEVRTNVEGLAQILRVYPGSWLFEQVDADGHALLAVRAAVGKLQKVEAWNSTAGWESRIQVAWWSGAAPHTTLVANVYGHTGPNAAQKEGLGQQLLKLAEL